jgi:dihydrofolate reductase
VISRTLPEPEADDVRVLRGGDGLAAAIAALKAEPGKNVQLAGATELASQLAALGLIEEYVTAVHPVVPGGGRRLFTRHGERAALELTESRTFDGRVVVTRYARA